MMSQLFLSLTAFSLLLSSSIYADEISEDSVPSQEEIADASAEETAPQKSRRLAFPSKKSNAAETPVAAEEKGKKEPLPKRSKPHFAGVRRTTEATPKPPPRKKSRKVKNEWFSSKTQPKSDKKQVAEVEKGSDELPSDHPYFVKEAASSLIASNTAPAHPAAAPESEGHNYPRTGFQAPRGHVFLTGEWLYWRPREEGLEFATSKRIAFEFHSGFRVGLGAHLPSFDGWCIYGNYTNYRAEDSRRADGSFYPLFLFQGAGVSGNDVAKAHGSWKIEFQNLDLEFGKAYYLTKTLVFSPFFGLKGAWIDQRGHFRYEGGYIPDGQTFRTRFKNDFKGAGPLIGTQMNWQLGAGFSFFGDVATALVVGHFDNTQKQFQLDGAEVIHFHNHFNLVSPFLQLVAGIAWDRNFDRNQCHFGLSAGFEAQQWWNQNQIEQFTDDVRPTYIRQDGDLSFYGLTLRARFDF